MPVSVGALESLVSIFDWRECVDSAVQQRCFVGVVTSVKGDFSESRNVNVRVATAEVKKYPEVFSKAPAFQSWTRDAAALVGVCRYLCLDRRFFLYRVFFARPATTRFKLYYLTPAVTHDRMVQALRGLTMSKHLAGVRPFFPRACVPFWDVIRRPNGWER